MSSLPDKVKLRIWPGGSWQQNGTEWEYVSALPIMRVMVAPNITHSKLVRCVQHKCGINPNIGTLKIAYQYSGQTYELLNTEDVQGFMQSAAAVRNPPTLFVYVDPEGFHTNNNVGGGSSSGWETNVSVAEESSSSFYVGGGSNAVREPDFSAVEQTQSYVPQFQHEDEHRVYGYNNDFLTPSNYGYSEYNPEIVPETQSYVPQFQHDFLSPNNYGYSEYNPEIVPETQEPVEEEEEEDESDVYHLDIPGITGEEEGDEEDDEEDGEEDEDGESSPIKSYAGINDFFGQPPPLPDRDDNLITPPQAPVGYNRSNRVNEGDIFVTKDELTLALGKKFVEEGYQYYVERSSNSRFEARCRDRSCDWRLYAANVKDSIMFQVRVMNDVHVCSRTQMHPNHRNANKRVLGHIILPKAQDVSRKLRGSDIVKDIKEQYNVDISYSQAWRAKAFALALVRGDPHDSYRRLPGFFYNLELQNPGTFSRIQTDITGRFNLCFYALGCAVYIIFCYIVYTFIILYNILTFST